MKPKLNTMLKTSASWATLAVVAAAFVGYMVWDDNLQKAKAIRPDNGCFAYSKPKQALVVVNDATDPLEGDQPRRWRASLDDETAQLAPASRIVAVSIQAATPAEVTFTANLCVPPAQGSSRADGLRDKFDKQINALEDQLRQSSTSPTSAISGTILAAATDSDIRQIPDGKRHILVESDLMEDDPQGGDAYSAHALHLAAPEGMPLAGYRIHFVVLRNLSAGSRQNRQLVQTWIDWAKASGATTADADAPWLGFFPVSPASAGGDK